MSISHPLWKTNKLIRTLYTDNYGNQESKPSGHDCRNNRNRYYCNLCNPSPIMSFGQLAGIALLVIALAFGISMIIGMIHYRGKDK